MTEEDWRPIETAPKDGTLVLLGNPEWELAWPGEYAATKPPGEPDFRWDRYGPRWQRMNMTDTNLNPTHWMPMPAPPKKVIHSPD